MDGLDFRLEEVKEFGAQKLIHFINLSPRTKD